VARIEILDGAAVALGDGVGRATVVVADGAGAAVPDEGGVAIPVTEGAGVVASSTAVADPAGGSAVEAIPCGLAAEATVTGSRVTGAEAAIWWQSIDRHLLARAVAERPGRLRNTAQARTASTATAPIIANRR